MLPKKSTLGVDFFGGIYSHKKTFYLGNSSCPCFLFVLSYLLLVELCHAFDSSTRRRNIATGHGSCCNLRTPVVAPITQVSTIKGQSQLLRRSSCLFLSSSVITCVAISFSPFLPNLDFILHLIGTCLLCFFAVLLLYHFMLLFANLEFHFLFDFF